MIVWQISPGQGDLPWVTSQPISLSLQAGPPLSLAFDPTHPNHLAAACEDGQVYLWDLSQAEPEPISLAGHTGAVTGVAFQPDGAILASGSTDSAVAS